MFVLLPPLANIPTSMSAMADSDHQSAACALDKVSFHHPVYCAAPRRRGSQRARPAGDLRNAVEQQPRRAHDGLDEAALREVHELRADEVRRPHHLGEQARRGQRGALPDLPSQLLGAPGVLGVQINSVTCTICDKECTSDETMHSALKVRLKSTARVVGPQRRET